MLLTPEHFHQLALIPLLLTFGPVAGGLIWINRRAVWYRSLSARRQLLTVLGLTAWLFVVGITFLNYRQWLDVGEVWIVRDGPQGIVKEDWLLIGRTEVGLSDGLAVILHADARHDRWLINRSAHTLRREAVFYGPCPPSSPYTASARLQALEQPLDIPPGTVLDDPWGGGFGNGPPPNERIVSVPKNDAIGPEGRCERFYWYAPLAPTADRRP